MAKEKKTMQELLDAAILRPEELNFINRNTKRVVCAGQRPLVLMALCSSIIGCVLRGAKAEGAPISKALVVRIVSRSVEL